MSEFDLISRYFMRPTPGALLGVGDDCALLQVTPGMQLAVSSDMLVSGTHFFADADPFWLGHKTLAVNLSDLAAMGARPRWATLSLSLPQVDEVWLAAFSEGFFALADRFGVELVGGDTTRGPLNLSVTIMGEVPPGGALRRDGARPGDDIWVSGELGAAALALQHLQGQVRLTEEGAANALGCLHRPQPRIELGMALRGLASSAIDVSDGLLSDLGHILERSGVGARLELACVPFDKGLAEEQGYSEVWQRCVLAGGDDYELCFTAPVSAREPIGSLAGALSLGLTRIGGIESEPGCKVKMMDGAWSDHQGGGYDHFA